MRKKRGKLQNTDLRNDFLGMIPKAKIDKWVYIKLKSHYTAEKITKRVNTNLQ